MEPNVGPLPSMDPHDPSSIQERSESPSLLSNSLMAGFSQDGDLERGDDDVNSLHKSAFFGNSKRRHRSSAFSSSLTWDSDSEKETFDEEELQQLSNPHGLAAHSPGSPTCDQKQDKIDCGVYRTPEQPKKSMLDKNLSKSLDAQGHSRDACKDPGMVQSSTQQCVKKHKSGCVPDQVGPLSSDTKPKEGCQKEKEEEKEFEQKRKEIKRAPERDVYTFPGDSDPESPPPGPWAHCTFIQRRRKKRALLRPFSGLNPWQCTPGTGRKTRVNPSRTKECSKFVKDKKGVFEFKEEEEEKVQDKELSREVKEELCQEIYTCVECSIYFKKAAHLREHMQEHGQDSGSKGQIGEDNSRRRRAKKSVSECTECGQNFADRLMLLDHHRRHQEKRNKILKEMEKLKEGRKRASCRNSRKPDEESMANSSQFVCLKCNYSSNVPRELAKHAKTHTARTKASGPRVSPRFQRKSCRKAWTRHSGNAASTTVVSDRYPTRASVQTGGSKPEVNHLQAKDCDPQSENKADLFPGPSQNHTLTTDPAEPTDKPELESAQTEAAPPASPCLQEESGSAEVGLGEENASKLQSPEPSLTNVKAETQQKDVVFKVTENRSSKRVGRRVIRRMKARRRLYPKCTNITDTSINMQNTEETTELNDKASVLPDPKENLSPANRTDVETSAPDLDLNAPFPPKASEDFKKETKEETPPESEKDECSQNTTVEKDIDDKINDLVDVNDGDDDDDKDDDDDGDDDGGDDQNENVSDNEDNDDIVNHLLEVLTEEEEAEDEEGILLQSVEKKCPYCQDCFDNGIGLANHIRGHLNRVGVSYKVRHFISPEEVNAIEKKFSYQKKKKKVANFDPATFSVMRCEFCSAGFDTRAGLSSHARAHLRDFGITNWEVTASPINVLRELFSKQPELALSITPAFNPETQDKTCKEEEESMLVNDGGTSESMLHITASPSQSWRKRQNEDEADGGNDKEEGNEQLHVQDDFNSSPGSNSSAAEEETGAKGSSLLKCEVCCALFETRRGLSSHARSHLRQLGVRVSESSGAPIDLLYQITMDRATDSHLSASPQSHSPTPSPQNTHRHTFCASAPSPKRSAEFEDEQEDIKPLSCLHNVAKSSPCPSSPSPSGLQPSSPFGRTPSPSHSLSASPSPVLRKAPISSLLPVSSPLRSPELRTMSRAHNSALSSASSRTLWASRETETPLNLTMDMDSHTDIICKLCGAWFETRKGLSSHARAHLRHFGVEYAESKGSPIDLLNTLILTDDFKRRATSFCPDSPEDLRVHGHNMAPLSPSTSTPNSASKRPLHSNSVLLKNTSLKSSVGSKSTSSSSSSSTHTLLRPPTKKLKTSSQQVFRMSGRDLMSIPLAEPMKDVCCEFCGELFENRKGLSSHARSHLRQLGITEWSVNGSPIDTLRDLITRRGLPCVMPLKPLKSSSCSPSPGPPQTLHQYSSTHGGVMGRQTFTFSQHQPAKMAVSSPVTSTSPTMLMVKPKPEPEQIEITVTGGGHEGYSSESLHPSWMSSDNAQSVNMLMTQEREPSRDIRCEFCGEFFENRKGLSSHARSHLRHMGITEWSVNGSPIDTLWEIMRNQSNTSASVVLGVKKEPEQESSSPYDSQGHQSFHVSPKASINLLHSGSRLHKHGFRSTGLSTTAPAGKFLGMKPTGKKFLGHAGHLGQRSPVTQSKTLSQPPQGFSSKGRLSTDKYGVGRMDASCELCGFAFENRKALASHARAHLRQFGVTEWSVNGSPIETLSAWMRSQPQTVAELHRSYLSDGPVAPKKKQSAAQWASLALSQGRTVERQIMSSSWSSLSRAVEVKNQNGTAFHHGISTQDKKHHSSSAIPHIQVARSELNVRVTRGIERRPLKHPLHADGGERESCPPKPTRTSTVPALVPKPPSTPLVKLVGKMYSLKCRFCDVEFHGPLSVQEDWIRHLQQHILKLDYNKPAPIANNTPAKSEMAVPEIQASATTSTSVTTTATTGPTPTSATSLKPTSVFTPCPPVSTTAPTPTLTPTLTVPTLTSSGNPTKAKQEVDTPAT